MISFIETSKRKKNFLWVDSVRRFDGINGIGAMPWRKAGVRKESWVWLPPDREVGSDGVWAGITVPLKQRIQWHLGWGWGGGVSVFSSAPTDSTLLVGLWPRHWHTVCGFEIRKAPFFNCKWSHLSRPKDSLYSHCMTQFSGGNGEAGRSRHTGQAMGNTITWSALHTAHGTRCSRPDGKTGDDNTHAFPGRL